MLAEHKIFADYIERKAMSQFYDAIKQPFVVKAAMMPDAHAGYSLPIGAAVATKDVIIPAWVGYDIGCGMCAVPTTFERSNIEANDQSIFDQIYRDVPVGFNHNKNAERYDVDPGVCTDEMFKIYDVDCGKQVGTLGGGNHFIEIGYDEYDTVWVITHSGSRGLGHKTAKNYMIKASMLHTGIEKAKEGHYGFSEHSMEGAAYIKDMNFCLNFALDNRKKIIERVVDAIKRSCDGDAVWRSLINRNHNHAEKKDGLWVHRKGATHAEDGMMGVIPGNMRDGSFIVEGNGNPDSLCSSSHGAGRVLGRKKAKETLNTEDFKDTMSGIKAKVDKNTLDESPFAYKDIFKVMEQQEDLVKVVAYCKPLINIKG